MSFKPLFALLLLAAAGTASAQSAPQCPRLPEQAADLQWTVLRTDSALLCRALRRDDGGEAFALTLSKKSPFKPNSRLREEAGQLQGEQIWWYRTEIAGRPEELARETLSKLGPDRVVHVSILTEDPAALKRYQGIVGDLHFEQDGLATR
jgi:hypothetical protein